MAEICGIAAAETQFDFDSAQLDAAAKARVAAIADCFTRGPLRERGVVLVGHADPRGTDAYNRELGMSRAEAVAVALEREGVAANRILLTSHGEAGADPAPEAWADERRVEVRITDLVPADREP